MSELLKIESVFICVICGKLFVPFVLFVFVNKISVLSVLSVGEYPYNPFQSVVKE